MLVETEADPLHHAAADRVGRGQLEGAVFRIEGFQVTPLAVEYQLTEEDVAREFDHQHSGPHAGKGVYGHFTTRQNLQFNWIPLP